MFLFPPLRFVNIYLSYILLLALSYDSAESCRFNLFDDGGVLFAHGLTNYVTIIMFVSLSPPVLNTLLCYTNALSSGTSSISVF